MRCHSISCTMLIVASDLVFTPLLAQTDQEPSRFTPASVQMAQRGYERMVWRDLRDLREQCSYLEEVLAVAQHEKALFLKAEDPRTVLSQQERSILQSLWQQFYLAFSNLDELAMSYSLRVGEVAAHRPVDNSGGHAVSMTARAAKLVYGYDMLALTSRAQTLAILFDETNAGRGLERGTFTRFRNRVFDVPERMDLVHFAKYEIDAHYVDTQQAWLEQIDDPWLRSFWHHSSQQVLLLLLDEKQLTSWRDTPTAQFFGDLYKHSEAAIVRPVATFFGATKVRRSDRQLIATEQITEMLPHLQPGDIFLEKTTYYLSNLFIHGFWGHAGLYLGSFHEAMSFFDCEEVNAYFNSLGYANLMQFLLARHPQAIASWRQRSPEGQLLRVLEGDGVKTSSVFFNSAEDAFASDYIAVLRPRALSKLDKALALIDGISYWRAAYDFDFDLRSDSALVCTELLAKAYASDKGKRGLHFAVGEATGGRYVVYPNSIAELFAHEKNQKQPQLEFVYFLKANEELERAEVADVDQFIYSYRWDSLL